MVSASERKVKPAFLARSMFTWASPPSSLSGGTHTVICDHAWTSCSARNGAGTQVKLISTGVVARMPCSMPAMVRGEAGPVPL